MDYQYLFGLTKDNFDKIITLHSLGFISREEAVEILGIDPHPDETEAAPVPTEAPELEAETEPLSVPEEVPELTGENALPVATEEDAPAT